MIVNREDSAANKYYGASQYASEASNKTQFNDGAGLFWPADAFARTNRKSNVQDTNKAR